MAAGVEVSLHDGADPLVEQEAACETVEERCEPVDRGDGHDPTRNGHPARLTQGGSPLVRTLQVVERPEEQDHVDRVVALRELPSVSHLGRETGRAQLPQGELDMAGAEIEQVDVVARVEQPAGVHAGSTADVEDPLRRWPQVSAQHLLGSAELELAEPAEPFLLPDLPVVPEHVVEVSRHGRMLGRAPVRDRAQFARLRSDQKRGSRGSIPMRAWPTSTSV